MKRGHLNRLTNSLRRVNILKVHIENLNVSLRVKIWER